MASSPPEISSSNTCSEIELVKETNHSSFSNSNSIQKAATHNLINKEYEKPAFGVVADQSKARKEDSTVTSLCLPFKSRQNLKPKSIDSAAAAAGAAANYAGEPRLSKNGEAKPNDNRGTSTGPRSHDSNGNKRSERKTEAFSRLVSANLDVITSASERFNTYDEQIKSLSERFKELKEKKGSEQDFRELKKVVRKFKQKISSNYKIEAEDSDVPFHSWPDVSANINRTNADKALDEIPNLYKNAAFGETLEFKEFEARYHELDMDLKMCLLCFSFFPEKCEIKKRVMIYWWIAEGFVPPVGRENTVVQTTNQKTPEEFANEYFNELITKGFIEPVRKKRSLGVDICKMHPFVRSMVIKLAKRANFFDFDDEGNANEDCPLSHRACLTGRRLTSIKNLENLHALFNGKESILEFKPEWFAKMKNVNILYLGRWQNSGMHHIEVEDTISMEKKNVNVLDGLENAKCLRLLGLQGISRIMELPESICKLTNLTILDIRACHNLEMIPEGIGLLKNLTHLDMSECVLLDHMPKGLALLSKLEVLNGFVVGDSVGKSSCTLDDLQKLLHLRKLSIHTGVYEFPSDGNLRALNCYKALRKLTIAWGRGTVQAKREVTGNQENGENNTKDINKAETSKQSSETPKGENREVPKNKDISAKEQAPTASKKSPISRVLSKSATSKAEVSVPALLPSQLIKLDLECFPRVITPNWMRAFNLKNLRKLYIRGGRFSDLGQFQDPDDDVGTEKVKWEVEELRLKYLTGLEMDWRELQELFPKLNYLEKVKCPNLTFFPCDESGVWMKET
ncbi:hypothetical protein U1Q18_010784 [Sarracenia purpurea var. burkii]